MVGVAAQACKRKEGAQAPLVDDDIAAINAALADRDRELQAAGIVVAYRAPTPDAPPFVEVGSTVQPGNTLCIIEAMKIMNEITAEVAGSVRKVLVENGQPVEFGQVLFLVEKSV